MSGFRLVAFDLDGTLLNSQHEFSSRSIRMLRLLHKRGIHIVFASGRAYTVLRRLVEALPLFHGSDAVRLTSSNAARILCAGSNGACVYDEDRTCLYSNTIPEDMCTELYKIGLSDPEVNLNVYLTVRPEDRAMPGYVNLSDQEGDLATDKWVCRYPDEKEAASMRGSNFVQHLLDSRSWDLSSHGCGGASEIFFICYDPSRRTALVEELQECITRVEGTKGVRGTVRLSPSAIQCIDVVPVTMSKAAALEFVANRLGVSLSECVAFGDGMNDAEMLREVGKGFVMGNANPALKAALPDLEVIGTNDDDAVAATVEALFHL
eukprot:gene8274-5793_t